MDIDNGGEARAPGGANSATATVAIAVIPRTPIPALMDYGLISCAWFVVGSHYGFFAR